MILWRTFGRRVKGWLVGKKRLSGFQTVTPKRFIPTGLFAKNKFVVFFAGARHNLWKGVKYVIVGSRVDGRDITVFDIG